MKIAGKDFTFNEIEIDADFPVEVYSHSLSIITAARCVQVC